MSGYTPKKQHAPLDPDVKIPAAIRAAAARSDALHKQAYEASEPPQQGEPPKQEAPVTPQGNPTAEQAPEPTQTPEATKPEQKPAAEQGGDNWEHKYNSIKGRYDRQEATISGLNGRIAQLESLLSRAQAAPPVQPTPDQRFSPMITEKDREDFGADFIDVAQRAAMEKLSPELQQMKQELERLKGTVGTVAAQTTQSAQQTLYAHLTDKVPNWREINRDPKFLAWANLPDPMSGVIRMTMLRNAFDQGDAQRVLLFFQGFLKDEAATAPAAQKPDTQRRTVPLESFAAPGRATAPAATTPPGEKETFTNAQIAKFYMDVQKGKYRGNEAEKDRIERAIFNAQAEGRIV